MSDETAHGLKSDIANLHDDISQLSQKVEQLTESFIQTRAQFENHTKVEDIVSKNLINTLNEMRMDFKERSKREDEIVEDLQEHFDKKIATCSAAFYSKHQIDSLVTETVAVNTEKRRLELSEAIAVAEDRTKEKISAVEDKAKLIAWVAATIMGAIMSAVGLLIAFYNLFNGSGNS